MRNRGNCILKKFFLPVLGVLYSCLVVSVSFIQAEEFPEENMGMSAEEMFFLEDIPSVFSASKYEQKVTEAPSSVSIITADEIRKYGYRNFREVLESVRGFHTYHDEDYGYLGVRGIGVPGDYNTRILLMIDGTRMNDNIYDSAALGVAFPLEVDLIDRVEIVRGPSSSLYGTSAFFAVINVISKKGRDFQDVELSAEAGTFDSLKGRVTYGNRYQSGLEVLVSGSYYDTDGDDQTYYREFDDPSTNNGLAENQDSDRYHEFFTKIAYQDFTVQGGYQFRRKRVPTGQWGTIFDDDGFVVDDETFWAEVQYEHLFDNQLRLQGRLSYGMYEYSGEYPYEGDPTIGEAPIVINYDSAQGDWLYGDVQLSKSIFEKHFFTGGIFYQVNFSQDQKTYYVGASDWGELDDKRDSEVLAFYCQDEFKIIGGIL